MISAGTLWKFANEISSGDYIFVKEGRSKIIGYGIVKSDYKYTNKKRGYNNNIRKVDWLSNEQKKYPIGSAPISTLTEIKKDIVERLKNLYCINDDYSTQLKMTKSIEYNEGEIVEKISKEYKREPEVRKQFLATKSRPYKCEVCGFEFEKIYGQLGKDYIEVHHIEQLSKRKRKRTNVNKDLICLCSNCHSMIHRREPCLTVEELNEIVKNKKNNKKGNKI